MFENPRRGRQARNFTTNVPKIIDLKSSSEQIFSENCLWVPLRSAQHMKNAFEYLHRVKGYVVRSLTRNFIFFSTKETLNRGIWVCDPATTVSVFKYTQID